MRLFGYRCLNTYPNTAKGYELTFDDGWEDNTPAICMLKEKLNTKPTVFLISGYLGRRKKKKNMDQSRDGRFYNDEKILELVNQDYIEIGGHSHTHPEFNKISENEQALEIANCIKYIEEKLEYKISKFCFPKGSWTNYSQKLLAQKNNYSYVSVSKNNAIPNDQLKFTRLRVPLYRKDGIIRFVGKILRHSLRLKNEKIQTEF